MSELLDELAERFELTDLTPRYAPDRVLVFVGSAGQHRAMDLPVLRYIAHPAGHHPKGCPLIAECTALELQTEFGSRWYGCERAYINSELRMVVVGTNPRDEVRMGWEVVPEDRRG